MDEKDILIRLQDFDWSRQQKEDFIAIIKDAVTQAGQDASSKYDEDIANLKSQITALQNKVSELENN